MNGGAGVHAMQARKNADERATGFWSRTAAFSFAVAVAQDNQK
jgi:hypothetical protein